MGENAAAREGVGDAMNEVTELDGVVDYGNVGTLFSDCFSPLALGAEDSDQVGVSKLFFKGLNDGSNLPFFFPFLRVFLYGSAGWEAVGVTRRQSFPWGWEEEGATDTGTVRQQVFFVDAGRAEIVWRVTGAGGVPRLAVGGGTYASRTTFSGEVTSGGVLLRLDTPFTNVFMKQDGRWQAQLRIDGRTRVGGGFVIGRGVHSVPLRDGMTTTEHIDGVQDMGYWLELGGRKDGEFRASVTLSLDGTPNAPHDAPAMDAAKTRWQGLMASLPATVPDTRYWRRKLAQAAAVSVGCGVRFPGYGNFADDIGIVSACSTWASTVFFWDHAFTAGLYGIVDPQWLASAVRFFLKHTSGGRMGPGILIAFPEYAKTDHFMDCYAPVFSWMVAKVHQCGLSDLPLAEMYPYLKDFHEHWFTTSDRDGDGIPEWRNSGNPADDSPLYDAYTDKPGKTACFILPPFPTVNMCAFLLMDARCLRQIAVASGNEADVTHWDARIAFLSHALMTRMWDAEDLFFYDLSPKGEMTRVRTFFGLLPLWAGVEMPIETARAAIRKHLLNPEEFWGDVPFPSVAYNEPTYDAKGYWRGRCWPHLYFFLTETLVKYGFEREADEARARYLRLAAFWKEPMENFPSQPDRQHHKCLPNYIWGAAGTAYFLFDWQRSPL